MASAERADAGADTSRVRLLYVHDPMCSWCWAFRPTLARLSAALPTEVTLQRVLGGLAPDDETPMPQAMRDSLQATWRHIARAVPGTRFDFSFWTENVPRRSTFRACRAVIAAREQDPLLETTMIEAIQSAYYLGARNPSERDVLIALAAGVGCEPDRFAADLDHRRLHAALARERALAGALGVHGFPSLVLVRAGSDGTERAERVAVDYLDPAPMLAAIETRAAALRSAPPNPAAGA